jgi:hypothetical protein
MKWPRCSVKTILLATATVAITCAGVLGYRQITSAVFTAAFRIEYMLAFAAPLYVPMIFGAFVLGCKKLSVPIVIAFAFAEATAIGILYLTL